jgi:catechol-2,3-dioxygenase
MSPEALATDAADNRQGEESMNRADSTFTKIDTVIVRVRNLEEAQAWHEKKLGFRADYVDEKERLVVLNVGGETSLTIYELKPGEMMAPQSTGSYPILYARDIQTAHKLLSERGVEVGSIEGEPGGTQWFGLKDRDGNLLEVCHYQ